MRICRHIALLLLCGSHELAAGAGDATHNPFARPAHVSETIPAQSSTMGAPTFDLRATLAAGADSLVNIDGKIVALGDEFAGYLLIAVGEGTAVFSRNGVRYPLSISH